MNRAVITAFNNITFLLIYEDDSLVECHPLCGEDNTLRIGNIYIGRVEKKVKNIEAAFIRLDKDNVGYLPLNDKPYLVLNRELPKGLSSIAENDLILVQVETEPLKQKQARVTGNICLSGQYAAIDLDRGRFGISKKIKNRERVEELRGLSDLTLSAKDIAGNEDGMADNDTGKYGIVLRTACENAKNENIISDCNALIKNMDVLIHKATYERKTGLLYEGAPEYIHIMEQYGLDRIDEIKTDIPEIRDSISKIMPVTFYKDDYPLYKLLSLETEISRLLMKRVWLKSGGFLVIEPTEAMVVIDVNSGKSIGKKKMETHIFETNMEAAREIIKQLRLRNLSGIIMIDFINMENADYKERLVKCLVDGFNKDKIPTEFVEITKLDVFEITRKKVRRPLHEIICLRNDGICFRSNIHHE